ncbi:hypothetical protein GZH46_01624 [Fragariocoptes setiger]|uniref:Uncharacterized protein n=1 Tax=Fragariocoptes setiger TaxID=1670756 RepID=A0ABQ7S8Y1_9ACAR|nr:hypothetical protein GZH46_01624 [Fragariocoptes setiger]
MNKIFLICVIVLLACVSLSVQATGHHHHDRGYRGGYGTGVGVSLNHQEYDSSSHYDSTYINAGVPGYGPSYGPSYGGGFGGTPFNGAYGRDGYYRGQQYGRESFGEYVGAGFGRFKRSTLSAEADKVLRAGSHLDTNNIPAVVDFVEKHKVGECLARVICELSNNPRSHGDAGAKLGNHLLKFRHVKHEKIGYYLQAMNDGAKTKVFATCARNYHCPARSAEVIEVTNKIIHL